MATAMTLYWYQLDSGTLMPTYYGQLDATVAELCAENMVTAPTAPWQSQIACSLVSTWLTQIDTAVRAVATALSVAPPATTLAHLDAGQYEATYWHQLDSCVRECINPTENTVAPEVTPAIPTAGDLLTTTDGTWTGGEGTPAFTYQWVVDSVAVSGATASTYLSITPDQNNLDAYCIVTDTNSTGTVSANSNTVTLYPPTANTVAPAVTPDPATAGDELAVTDGTWVGGPNPVFTYQWVVDGVSITGSTASTYQSTTPDEDGLEAYCVVTNTNDASTASADSNTVVLQAP